MDMPSRLSGRASAALTAPPPADTVRLLASHVEISLVRQRVHVDGLPVHLTPIEWRILAMLIAHANHAVPMETLTRALSTPSRAMSHVALVRHVSNLRQKLGQESIETIRLRGVRVRVLDDA